MAVKGDRGKKAKLFSPLFREAQMVPLSQAPKIFPGRGVELAFC